MGGVRVDRGDRLPPVPTAAIGRQLSRRSAPSQVDRAIGRQLGRRVCRPRRQPARSRPSRPGGVREFEVARCRIGRGLVIGGLVIGGLGLVIGGFLSPFYEFAALIALASWLLGVAGAVGAALGSMRPSRQLRHAKACKELPAARVVA